TRILKKIHDFLKRYIEKITIFIKRYLTYLGVGNLFENYGELSDPWTKWEASVVYGSFGQRTVAADTMMFHLGGRTYDLTVPSGDGYNSYSFIEYYDEDYGYWRLTDKQILARAYCNAEYWSGNIYIVNGLPGGSAPLGDLEIYDIETNSLTSGTPIPTPRGHAGSAMVNGKLYIVGGIGSDNIYTSKLEIYDTQTDSWSNGADLPAAIQTEMAAYNNKLYVLGGYDGSVHDEVYEYNIDSDSWTQIGTMPYPTSAHKLAVYDGFILSLGDFDQTDRVLKYDIANNNWTEYNSNILPRRHASAVLFNNKIYYVAGNSNEDGYYQYYRAVQSINTNDLVTSLSNEKISPTNFRLEQNYPNPFNPTTKITFTIPSEDIVSLSLYNSIGERIETLVSDKLKAGSYSYEYDATKLASGVYFYELNFADQWSETKKMLLLK
ncbi:MAG: T9SS type A sorting domain-containing protein, partial [Melioribacteraceae bacterium]|nr:T9SS type A sorting domain-containing protein [Melioribacteraceae bacterium]MCF8356911.1 T9SS type A sorting domain-containing protein [Melioribacteraceae bacterium]MCF8396278.1 T9SS type A sorting domain-containing protein [Melioribacteraceae bacterium]MCF8420646.1 T9SS type A sorting domain-containing protein [Melioribacteraceae bacterium]